MSDLRVGRLPSFALIAGWAVLLLLSGAGVIAAVFWEGFGVGP